MGELFVSLLSSISCTKFNRLYLLSSSFFMRSGKRAAGNVLTNARVSDKPRASGSSATQPSSSNVKPDCPSLLSQISEPIHLQELPLVQNQQSIKKCSSNVTHSSRITERGRSQNRQYTWESKQNSSKPSEMMEIESMQPSDRSSRLLKATTPRQPWPYKGGQKGTVNAEHRSLLSRILMTSRRTKSECPKYLEQMN